MAVKMLNVPSLPNIPWQEKPADYKLSSPVWRYSENPVMGRNPTPEIAASSTLPLFRGRMATLPFCAASRSTASRMSTSDIPRTAFTGTSSAKKCPLWMTTATRKCRTTPMTRVW